MERKLLLTLDEARDAISTSALDLIEKLKSDDQRLLAWLWGRGTGIGRPLPERRRIIQHRMLIEDLCADGLDWLVEEELMGASSYAGLIPEEAFEEWIPPLASGE